MAATTRLEVEPGELQAEYRPALTAAGREGLEAEIYLYDTLAGGAGFSRRISDLGDVEIGSDRDKLVRADVGRWMARVAVHVVRDAG